MYCSYLLPCLLSLLLQNKDALLLLTIALMMAVLGIAGHCFSHHVALMALPIVGAMTASAPRRTHARYFWAAIYAISEALLAAQLIAICKSPYIAIMMDSSTDISKDEHVLVYVQYLDMSSFKVVTQYLCTTAVANKTAKAIYNQLLNILQVLGLQDQEPSGTPAAVDLTGEQSRPKPCIAAFCSDGGSEYAGKKTGVGALLKEGVNGWLLRVHCFAHRIALVMNDQVRAAVKFVRGTGDQYTLGDIDSILKDVHGLFAHSGKRKKQWNAFVRQQGLQLRAFPVYNQTRWLSRCQCLDVLVANLPTLLLFLECMVSKNQRWGSDVLERLKDPDFVVMIHIVCDVANVVNTYNTSVQKDALLVFDALSTLDDVVNALKGMIVCDPVTKEPLQFAAQIGKSGSLSRTLKLFSQFTRDTGLWRFRPGRAVRLLVELPDGWMGLGAAVHFAHSFVVSIVASIDTRFPHRTIIQGLKVLHPASWIGVVCQDTEREHWMPKGHILAFRQLIELFSMGASPVFAGVPPREQQQARIEVKKKFMAEADAFAKHMISVVKSNPLISFVDAWKFLLSDRVRGHILFPNFTQLFYIALVTPVHTATVERGFSIHRVLKNRLSNKLKLTTLDSLMRIKMIVDRDAWTKHDLSSAVAVYTKQHPRSEKAPALLAKLHVAFNEGAQWPECLADAGVGAFDEFELDGIDVEVDSDEDFDPGDDTDMDDDAAWALAGLVEEGDMVAALAAPDVTQHDSDDFMLEDADGDL